MTTRSSPPASEQPAQRSRSKREQVLVACKVCRGRKTKVRRLEADPDDGALIALASVLTFPPV